ncbi:MULTISPECIES: ABC transporter ATP-binding protein [Caproicibacterium]|mgnify:CR=1 FL=1|jgi:ABC-2 type transport system ATP-binding protein|uniref:ATP-binding cassette domain-containing protein n=1 Tax=Caproicibacterium lactatifermentans TaxID=2666138 RepID=A0A859DTK5_9FIRM|nr:ABC transporter ATP-binding protein [Caproicibacterium lactatifermentans]ARP50743.1 ABC transporter [Ruminococcaceae bacterium CPB6]MDD4807016.1 ABC transporter ATP-binding protein [Oscillospiraceae bacterium]QKN23523.1 ATP-binding cassette domain-containing protein [Caproicibacterium lactatifermentans]QKO29798.1 ATP-binding cassette domain-containing protein [Caproicibacterium lactatifermentans]
MEPILQCSGLCKNYVGKTALQNVNLKVERGRIVGLLGPNGSGKSTLIKLCSGLLTPSTGILSIAGMAPGVETKKIVSYLPEHRYLSDWMCAKDLLTVFSDFYADFDMSKALDMLQRLGISLSSRLRTMSKGTREKMQLILVMSRNAQLYLLDEPIGGVDPATRDYILNTIISNYSENATVIISTHLIADVEKILDEVIFLREGSVLLHTPADELREHEGKSVDACFREVFKC